MADTFVKHAKAFIAENKDEPFFLFFSAADIHVPRAPHPRFQGSTELGFRGDAMVQFDWATGAIVDALEAHGLTENTIVIFSSDNGPVYDDGYVDGTVVKTSEEEVDQGHDGSGIYRGGKYSIYEGGARVPFILRWPKQIEPGISDVLLNQVDLMASFAALLEIPLAEDEAIDSRNTLEAFLGKSEQGLDYMLRESRRDFALRRGEWKYIPGNGRRSGSRGPAKPELFNLAIDPDEQNNLIKEYPEIAESMAMQLEAITSGDRIR